jgi:predicted Zn-dependent peptidase
MTKYQQFHLPSGTPVCVAEMPWMESVSTGIWAAVGGRHDPVRLTGLAHFVEHMVFQGTSRRTARRLNREVESAGGSMDAYTSEDHTAFFVRGPGENFGGFMDVLLDLYQNSIFDPNVIVKERDVIAEEISMYREQPSQHVEDLLCRNVWPQHPLGQPIAGTEQTIGRIEAGVLMTHAAKYFGARNSVISVAGRITAEEVEKVLTRLLPDGLPRDVRPTHRPFAIPRRRLPTVVSETRDIDQVQLALAFHAPGRLDPIQPALRLLNVMLGENTSSRLWSELREKRGLCYDAGSDLTALQETGLIHIYAGIDPDKYPQVLKVIFTELHRLATKAVSPATLRAAVDFSIASGRMALESTSHQMTMMAECLLLYGRPIELEAVHRRLRAVTPERVRRIAAAIFRPGRLTAATVGPEIDPQQITHAAAALR